MFCATSLKASWLEILAQSEKRYRSLVENTLDGYIVFEIPSGQVLFLNQTACELFGYTMQEGIRWISRAFVQNDHESGLKCCQAGVTSAKGEAYG